MWYVCVRGVMDVVFSVCIVTCGAVGARHADVVCLCFYRHLLQGAFYFSIYVLLLYSTE